MIKVEIDFLNGDKFSSDAPDLEDVTLKEGCVNVEFKTRVVSFPLSNVSVIEVVNEVDDE